MTKTSIGRRNFLIGTACASSLVACGSLGEDLDWRTTSAVEVQPTAQGQGSLASTHCSLSLDLSGLVEVGDQVRIQRSASEYALYTVTELREELGLGVVRMSSGGRGRLGAAQGFAASLDTQLTANHLSDAEAQANNEFVERLIDDGSHSGLLVAAAHGGKIETYTDRQAERMADTLAGISAWICKGWRNPSGAFSRWHITSTELSPNSFPGLGVLAGRGFGRVVSFHGMSAPGVLIGGRAPIELREELREAIIAAIGDLSIEVHVSGEDGPLAGVGPLNFVNWLTATGEDGIQIEQSYAVRRDHWAAIADAVAAVLGA